jgi:hypothetical protein
MGESITLLSMLCMLYPLILCLLCTPFSLTNFLIGVINISSCPSQPLIPIWILVTGIILFIPTVTGCLYVSNFYLTCFNIVCKWHYFKIIPCSARYVLRPDEKENERSMLRILLFTGLLLAIWSVPVGF